MAGFKHVPQTYLFHQLLKFWGNMVKNYDEDCTDDDFFDVVRNCFDHDRGVELVEAAYTHAELGDMANARSRYARLDLTDPLDDVFQTLWNRESSRKKCRAVLDAIRECLAAGEKLDKDDIVGRRFAELKRVMKLDDLEFEVLLFAYVRDQTCFCWPLRVEDRLKPLYYAMALDRSYDEVSRAMSPQGTLLKYNLLDNDYDFCRGTLGGYMDGVSEETIDRRFYTRRAGGDVLPWSFFGDLAAKDGEVLKRIVSAGGGRCNILLYGAPGTGKTSFARSLAAELGRTAFEINQGDKNGANMKSEARMMGIKVCNAQETPDAALMIVDEADELLRSTTGDFGFEPPGGGRTEKGVMNALLDEMRMPAVWISNAPAETMDESVRRRFDYSIRFERLNTAQRAAIWRNLVAKHGLGGLVGDGKAEAYAAKYETSAGGISMVLANVKRLNPEPEKVDELVETLMRPHCRLMGVRESGRFLPAKDYSLDGLNIKGKVSLPRLVRAARNYLDAGFRAPSADRPRLNVLLYGPPGTGKTEFVKYLGRELDRKVLVMRGSDILSKWVGGSEQNIANAFRRAESERAILFFDEVDGLLQDRAGAQASWEVTQVNELLQQMEDFDGLMVAATNFAKNLDPATMRRFTFKLEFGYLEDGGKRLFFERFFGSPPAADDFAALRALGNLAPGDFRTVRQEQFYLGENPSNAELVAALAEECRLKRDGASAPRIGFAD